MKVLYLTNGYPPLQNAGTEMYTAGIASEFASRGHEVKVVCCGDWEVGANPYNGVTVVDDRGVQVYRLNLNWTRGNDPNRSLYYNPVIETEIAKILIDCRPDVVHVTSCNTLSASMLPVVKSQGCPLLITLTDFWFLCPRVNLLRSDGELCDGQTTAWMCLKCTWADSRLSRRLPRGMPEKLTEALLMTISRQPWLSRQRGFRGLALDMGERKDLLPQLLALADLLIAPSKFLAQMYVSHSVQTPIRVVEYGHDLTWVSPIPKVLDNRRLVFGYVGRITHSKGVHIFTAALAVMPESVRLEGHVWGDPEQEPEYFEELQKTYTAATPLVFCGKFTRAQIGDVYHSIDVLVVPSLWYENNPLVIQEAFAAGVPVIATNLGGMAEFVEHNRNGLLFEAGDVHGLAEAMQRIVVEPGLLENLRRELPRVKSVQEEADVLAAIYNGLVR